MLHFGIDSILKQEPHWKAASIGFVTNHAATTRNGVPSRKALLDKGFHIQKLFSPEHGLDVKGADGHLIRDGVDPLTGLQVTSLYGDKLAPSQADLTGINLLLFDIPDIGSRFYTYLWTMTYAMEAAAKYHIPFVVLDRPNPISGNMDLCEGPMLDAENASFIGRWPIPARHSCSLGELARYFNTVQAIHAELEVVACKGWQREQFQPDWHIPFVPTSPAIQRFESMLLYPGLCLLEATNISEGRGTPFSFTVAGAPWMDGEKLADIINDMSSGEVLVTPVNFTPSESKYAGLPCSGITFDVKEPLYFNAVMNGLLVIKVIQSLYPAQFSWRPYPTHVNPGGKQHLDKLTGISNSEALFNLPFPSFIAAITRATRCEDWKQEIKDFLLY